MSKPKTWGDAIAGDVVTIGGREWHVDKVKAKGKRAVVTMSEDKLGTRKGEVKLSDTVAIKKRAKAVSSNDGTQQRWATPAELDDVLSVPSPHAEPPAKKKGGLWDRPSDRAEKMLGDLLSAHLVGESVDGGKSYYVPPVDVSTIATHLSLFHGVDVTAGDEGAMLETHAKAHAAAEKGDLYLLVDHRHTAKRPG